jgi:hypothetical protein
MTRIDDPLDQLVQKEGPDRTDALAPAVSVASLVLCWANFRLLARPWPRP